VSRFVANNNGVLTVGHARLFVSAVSTVAKVVVYADNAGEPGAQLGETDEFTVANTTDADHSSPFTGANQADIVNGTAYHIGATWVDPGGVNTISMARDNLGVGQAKESPGYAPDPFGTATSLNGPVAAYVEYLPAATADDGAFFEFF
jgi:hypothetical protein